MSARSVSPSPRGRSDAGADISHPKDAEVENRSPRIRITVVVANRYAFDTEVVTGRQIKEKANVPAGFALYRRTRGGNESIRDDDRVQLHDGDHFFARPPGSPRATSDDQEDISR
jgi:hypothetical protein